jgi:uncharacterized protein YndB with AHSA1/START domain
MDPAPSPDDLIRDTPIPLRATATVTVQRSLDVDASPTELWRLISDPGELSTWLAPAVDLELIPGGRGRCTDDDGVGRHLVVDAVEPERQVVLRWWRDDDGPGAASVVTMAVAPRRGGARLVVTEQLLTPPAGATVTNGARASAQAAISAWQWRLDLLLLRFAALTEAVPQG